MDIYSKKNQENTQFIKNWAEKNLNHFEFINLSYLYIDLEQSHIQMISHDLSWFEIFWKNHLDRVLSERLRKKYTLWSELSATHQETLALYQPNSEKIDVCLFHEKAFELFSIHTQKRLNIDDYLSLNQCFPSLSYYAHRLRKKQNKVYFYPIQDPHIFCLPPPSTTPQLNNIFQIEKRYRFNNINLTALEIKYLQCLSALMSQKEIAYKHQVSETAVRKTIGNIKRKMGNESMPNSMLFKMLKQHGVTLTYMNHLIP